MRLASIKHAANETTHLKDPMDNLMSISEGEPTVDNLITALGVTSEEVELIQLMTLGQRNNPRWMDARQWRITASKLGSFECCIQLL